MDFTFSNNFGLFCGAYCTILKFSDLCFFYNKPKSASERANERVSFVCMYSLLITVGS